MKPTAVKPLASDGPRPKPTVEPLHEISEPLVLASRWQRLLAKILDVVIVLSGMFGGLLLIAFVARGWGSILPKFLMVAWVLSWGVVRIRLLATRGQDFGKAIVGIRIVCENNAPAGIMEAFVWREAINGLIGVIPVVGSIYLIADVLYIFSPTEQCLHDRLAGTKVVRVNRKNIE